MSVPTTPVPPNADLDRLKTHAKALRDGVRHGVSEAIEVVRGHHPRLRHLVAGSAEATGFRLADAQLTLARRFALSSWPRLVAHLRVVADRKRSPHLQPVGGGLRDDDARAAELLRLACLTYGTDDPVRPLDAARLLASHPHLSGASLHTAAATGDVTAARAWLAADPGQVRVEAGPFGWEPLLYLTYSRLSAGDALGTARVLLDAGADPNAGFLWDGLVPPFTALTGVFGGGENDPEPHPRWPELARLLLERGADPNDAQTIYNQGLGGFASDDTAVLELLCEFGFGRGDGGPWRQLLGDQHPTPTQLVQEELAHAAHQGLPARTRLLLALGADPDRRGAHPAFGGRTAYQSAVAGGHLEVADLLVGAGADPASVDPITVLTGRLLAGDRVAVADPGLEQVREREPDLVATATRLGRADAVRTLVGLGWDVDARHRTTPLHEAAMRGDRALVDVLLDLGADPTVRDTSHDGTPAGWARHFGHHELAAHLDERA